jgi:hypothetical protein
MSRMFSSGLRIALLISVVLALAAATAANAAKDRSVQIESVTIDQDKVVGGQGFTGTVTLNQVAPTNVGVTLFVSADRPEYASVTPDTLTIPAGSTSATFTGATTIPLETDLVGVQALLSDGNSTVTPSDTFFLVANEQTDLIEITRATVSKSGTVNVTAVSDDSAAILTATFNEQPVPGETRDGKFRGQLQLPAFNTGIVEVRSDLGGCATRDPSSSSGTITCRG